MNNVFEYANTKEDFTKYITEFSQPSMASDMFLQEVRGNPYDAVFSVPVVGVTELDLMFVDASGQHLTITLYTDYRFTNKKVAKFNLSRQLGRGNVRVLYSNSVLYFFLFSDCKPADGGSLKIEVGATDLQPVNLNIGWGRVG